jgi:hypothetical protein
MPKEVQNTVGLHAIRAGPKGIQLWLKVCKALDFTSGSLHNLTICPAQELFIFNVLYTNVIPLIKISIVLLYRRIFPLPNFKIICYVLVGLLACFQISTTLVDLFGCHPIAAGWDKTIPNARCIDPKTLYMATAGINLATDIIILCLPMPLVWGLHLPLKRKLGVSFIFVLGSV